MPNPDLNLPASLTVTDQTIDISGFSRRQKEFYLKLFWDAVEFYRACNRPRAVIGIAGPTGAGKSVMAVLFKELAAEAGLAFALESVTIDAYHYPNAFLNSHFADGEPLKKFKGRFDTYDVPRLAQDIQSFRSGQKVSFPIYSRKLHDPVEGGVTVAATNALLIVEGLWLLYDRGAWGTVRELLDYSFFIEADKEWTKQPVLQRHMTGGRTLEDASRHYELVDGRNSDLVLTTKHRADKIIPPYYAV